MSSAEFWRLIDRLGIPDADALGLIDYPGKLPASAKRPRFRLTTRQTRLAHSLAEVGVALEAAGETPVWLQRRNPAPPFAGHTPLAIMVAGSGQGISEVMRFLTRLALRRSVAQR
jgi:hypothetical protein